MKETTWRSYEDVAVFLLDQICVEFGLQRVEGKQSVIGKRSGTIYEIDGKGILSDGEGFIIIECRRYNKARQNQERIGGLAYRIIDTGANGAIIVSPLGLQKGAKKIASAEKISCVHLNKDCNALSYILKFLNEVMIGLHETAAEQVSIQSITWEKVE